MTASQALAAWGAYSRDDPFPVFAEVRELGAVHEVTLVDGHRAWLVVRYEETRAALNDPRLSKDMHAALAMDADLVAEGLPGPAFARHMLSVDPPDHTRPRRWYMTADPGGVSALTMQKLLDLGSYQTAWTMLHRYRSAMVRPRREVLTGRVEVDETFLGGERPGVRGRGALGKTLVVIAVELREPRGYGRARMSIIPNAEAKTLRKFLITTVEPGATVVTEGWAAYPTACRDWFAHEPHPVSGSGQQANELLPAVHRVAALCKRWLLGTHQGRVEADHLQSYLEVLLPLQPAPLPRPRAAVLPPHAIRHRHAAADLPTTGGRPAPQGDQTARREGTAIPARQPSPTARRPALTCNREPRVTQHAQWH